MPITRTRKTDTLQTRRLCFTQRLVSEKTCRKILFRKVALHLELLFDNKRRLCYNNMALRGVAQFGSAPLYRAPENRSERSERDFWDEEERSAHASIALSGRCERAADRDDEGPRGRGTTAVFFIS